MTKAMKNRIIYSTYSCVAIAIMLFSRPLWATTVLYGNITGDELQWSNASYSDGGYLVPSQWQPISHLTPTSEWLPGGYISSDEGLTLMGDSDAIVTIPDAQVFGISYRFSGFSKTEGSSDAPTIAACDTSDYGTLQVDVYGVGCAGNRTLKLDKGTTRSPFQFLKPSIVGIDVKSLVAAFQNADASAGLYTGTMYVKPAYAFRQPVSEVWTYRYVESVPVTVMLQYQPAMLANITVSGNGVISPSYDVANKVITGETRFGVTAEGTFSNGLRLTFEHKERYEMKPFSPRAEAGIPYDITCIGCLDTDIVENGILNELQGNDGDGAWTLAGGMGRNATSVNLNLVVSYELKKDDLKEISSGKYRGSFIVVFEANL